MIMFLMYKIIVFILMKYFEEFLELIILELYSRNTKHVLLLVLYISDNLNNK